MVVCITGATGFVGKKLIEHYLSQGDEVRYLTRDKSKLIKGAKIFIGDLVGPVDFLAAFLENASLLLHCAGEIVDESLMRNTHIIGTQNLLKAVDVIFQHKHSIFHWIQLSSCGAYGQTAQSSSDKRFVDENSFENPNGEYEDTKTKADQLVISFAKKNDWFKYSIIRPTIVFGQGMRSTAIVRLSSLIKKRMFFYIGNKNAVANYVHVDDVVSAMTLSINKAKAYNQVFIVSNDCKFSDFINVIADAFAVSRPRLVLNELILRKFITIVRRWVKLPISNEHVDVMMRQTYYSNDKLKKYINWSPKASVLVQLKEHIGVKSG